jgi:hypothetical protein
MWLVVCWDLDSFESVLHTTSLACSKHVWQQALLLSHIDVGVAPCLNPALDTMRAVPCLTRVATWFINRWAVLPPGVDQGGWENADMDKEGSSASGRSSRGAVRRLHAQV